MTYRKKLIEVALPLIGISEASATEKNIHTGLPANLHTWWSRKPLAASRAIVFAALVDDPEDRNAPTEYVEYCKLLPKGENAQTFDTPRQRLFDFIERLIAVESRDNIEILSQANKLIRLSAGDKSIPSFLDPFAGGGSIPLEAFRLGLKSYATDLNPVAVILNKALIEIPSLTIDRSPVNPKDTFETLTESQWVGTRGLEADIEYYAKWIFEKAEERIGRLYPTTVNSETVISWIWARNVTCPNPTCKGKTPLTNKFWVSTHKGNEAWINPIIDNKNKTIDYQIQTGIGTPREGTVNRSGAECLFCKSPIPFDYIRKEGQDSRIDYDLMCVVVDGGGSRRYMPPNSQQISIATSANPQWHPQTDLPEKALGFRVQNYGITRHSDLFTNRQLLALTTFSELIEECRNQIIADSSKDNEYANAVVIYLALAVDRLMQTNNTLVRWLIRKSGTSKGTPAFDRQIVSMIWEFSEGNVFGDSVGSWNAAVKNVLSAFKSIPQKRADGIAFQHDAADKFLLNDSVIVSTDPPYFDNIGYADLSDFYYIWLRKALQNIYPKIFGTMLTPKSTELIVSPERYDGDKDASEKHFVDGLRSAFANILHNLHDDYPLTVYYAFKQTEDSADTVVSTGWETMLDALLDAGFIINGTWPITTEQKSRLRAVASNALASSIVLVCRKRSENAPTISRRQFVDELRRELPTALKEMQSGNIAPVDLAQASIGPGMAIYSRYSKVLEADGTPMSVRTALGLINQVLDETLSEQDGDIDPDTRFAVAWFTQFGFEEGDFGQADVLARGKNTSVAGVEAAGVVDAGRGKVKLKHWSEYDPGTWDPTQDKRPTVWEATHHLIERLNSHGEKGSALLMNKMPHDMAAEARQLAYRLYSICERKGWADHARDYNALVVSWSGIGEVAAQQREATARGDATTQMSLFDDEA